VAQPVDAAANRDPSSPERKMRHIAADSRLVLVPAAQEDAAVEAVASSGWWIDGRCSVALERLGQLIRPLEVERPFARIATYFVKSMKRQR